MMPCSRCEKAAVTSTRGEQLCKDCYISFINRKFRANMADFRVNGVFQRPTQKGGVPSTPLITVFMSFGVCSLAMLDMLLDMQAHQRSKNSGLCGFDLKVVHIGTERHSNWPWKDIEVQYYPLVPIEEVVNHKLSRSTQHDMNSVLVRQTANQIAAKTKSTSVFGYSVTRLSELTLAETIKGRGAGIPDLVSPSLIEDHCVYPLKDIMLPEIVEYCKLTGIDKYAVSDPVPPGITKMQSIDEIVHQYFTDVQQSFPSVVSTVAKVASRLCQPAEECVLCHPNGSPQLCYACSSALQVESLNPLDLVREHEL